MLLCLDVGNTQIFAGVFQGDELLLRFRYDSQVSTTSDQFGIFLKSVLRENNIKQPISAVALCSVVPQLDYSLLSAIKKYFNLDTFRLQSGVKTGLNIKYYNPLEVGADRIANAIAATQQFPNKPLIIVDFGTATTFCVVTADRSYLGGMIMAGLRLSMQALQANTAKLSSVPIVKPANIIGRSTMESIQAGLYYSQLASIKELSQQIIKQHFADQKPLIIGTGGVSHLFASEKVFDLIEPDLVLHGLRLAWQMNQ